MSRDATYFAPGEFYHVFNRGVEKRRIFEDDRDKERFLKLLYVCNSNEVVHLSNLRSAKIEEVFDLPRSLSLVNIGAYCLMPNHFHLLIYEKDDGGISKFMQKVTTAYTMYFNKKYSRSGALFQGVFKAEHCDTDNYLKYMFTYIHLNPVKLIQKDWKEVGLKDLKKCEKYLQSYIYSSFLDYSVFKRIQSKILELDKFPKYFDSVKNFKSTINDWLEYDKNIKAKP